MDGGPLATTFKIVLVGASGVGKSTLVARYVGTYSEDMAPVATLGVDYSIHNHVADDDTRYSVQLWDTSGAARFEPIVRSYFPGAHALIAVVDLAALEYDAAGADAVAAARQHLAALYSALSVIDVSRREPPLVYIVGNKADLVHDAPFDSLTSRSALRHHAAAVHGTYIDCSARTGFQATAAVDAIVAALIDDATRKRSLRTQALVPRPRAPDWARAPWTEGLAVAAPAGGLSCWCCYAQ